jgi:hypothetical protein
MVGGGTVEIPSWVDRVRWSVALHSRHDSLTFIIMTIIANTEELTVEAFVTPRCRVSNYTAELADGSRATIATKGSDVVGGASWRRRTWLPLPTARGRRGGCAGRSNRTVATTAARGGMGRRLGGVDVEDTPSLHTLLGGE